MAVIIGTPDDDFLPGTPFADEIFGLAGNDEVEAGSGIDVIDGGKGIDTLTFLHYSTGTITIDISDPARRWTVEDGSTIRNIEVLNFQTFGGTSDVTAGNGNDTLAGGSGDDVFHGGGGDDTISGAGGHDLLFGEAGNDLLIINIAIQSGQVDGGDGIDTLRIIQTYGHGDFKVELGAPDQVTTLRDGLEVTHVEVLDYYGSNGRDVVAGNKGDDTLRGDQGNDRVEGGRGNDQLFGGIGSDILRGGAGDDRLAGDSGNSLAMDEGHDTLTGGEGADTFVFNVASTTYWSSNSDTITDFVSGTDTIELARSAFTKLFYGPLSPDYFQIGSAEDANDYIVYDDVSGMLWYNPNGSDPRSSILIATLSGAPDLTAADFLVT